MCKKCLIIIMLSIMVLPSFIKAEEEEYLFVEDDVYRYCEEPLRYTCFDTISTVDYTRSYSPGYTSTFNIIPVELVTMFNFNSSYSGNADFEFTYSAYSIKEEKEIEIASWFETYTMPLSQEFYIPITIDESLRFPSEIIRWAFYLPRRFNNVGGYVILNKYYIYDENLGILNLHLNGGSLDYIPKVYPINEEYVLPTPIKEDYEFVGWCFAEDLSDASILSLDGSQKGTIDLYAKYANKQSSYSLLFPKHVDLSVCDSFTYGIKGNLLDDEVVTMSLGELWMENVYKSKVQLDVELEKKAFNQAELDDEYHYYTGTILHDLSAGSWQGSFFVDVMCK